SNPFYVTNGLLTVELISGRMQTGDDTFEDRKPANVNVAGDFDDPNAPTYASFVGKANAGGDHPDPSKLGQKVTATLARDGTVGNDPSKASITNTQVVYFDDVTKHNIPKAMWDFLNLQGDVKKDGKVAKEALSTPGFNAQLYYTEKDRVHQKAREAGFNWMRQQVAWEDLQGVNRLFAWGELDAVVKSARDNKQKLILSIAKSPKWASPNTNKGMPVN